MALNYNNILGDLGRYIAAIDDIYEATTGNGTPSPDLPQLLANLETNLSDDRFKDGLHELFDSLRDQFNASIDDLRGACEERMIDLDTVLREIPGVAEDESLQNVLAQFIQEMNTDGYYVTGNTSTVGAATADAANTGDGIVLTDTTLDGVSEPRTGFPAVRNYLGKTTQLTPTADTLSFTCTADSYSGGTEGFESFSVVSLSSEAADELDWRSGGAGESGSLTAIQANSLIANGDFQSFSGDVPTSWTLDAGTASTHVLQETGVGNFFKGASALELNGDATQASIQISQDLAQGVLTPGKRYVVSAWVKGNAGVTAGTLTIQCEGTGYTPGGTEKIEMNAAALAAQTSFGNEYFFFNVPYDVPSDFELVVKWTGTPSNHEIYIDNLFLAEALWFGGAAFHVVGGSTAWVQGDKVTVALSNNDNGTYQTAFRKIFNVQLPSSGSSLINDSNAQ